MIFSLLVHQNSEKLNVLRSTVESLKILSYGRDPETAEHQQRMATYSLLIAREIADSYQLTDPVINYIYLYAPLHDLGKLMIADSILLKAGPLTKDEFSAMQEHTNKGDELAEKLINVYQLSESPYISILRSIIRWHHEKIDGSGYPDGLKEEQIPIAVRIVEIADIFDALTSVRPYKSAWTNEEAFKELRTLAGNKLDSLCVDALIKNKQQILKIQDKFKDKVRQSAG
jgi:HD-GYP domain-containing protein (c-di-GMP phosphodiesterase class II)